MAATVRLVRAHERDGVVAAGRVGVRSEGRRSVVVNVRDTGRPRGSVGELVDAWLWGPAVASFLAPLVAAGAVLLGLFGSLIGFSPDWGAATASFGTPAVLSSAVLAATWHLTRRVAGRADTTAGPKPGQGVVHADAQALDGQCQTE